jgi:hypothetical protein
VEQKKTAEALRLLTRFGERAGAEGAAPVPPARRAGEEAVRCASRVPRTVVSGVSPHAPTRARQAAPAAAAPTDFKEALRGEAEVLWFSKIEDPRSDEQPHKTRSARARARRCLPDGAAQPSAARLSPAHLDLTELT